MADTFASTAKTLLDKQVEVTYQLLEALQKEYAILKQADTGDLEEVAATKQELVDKLEGLTKQWLSTLLSMDAEITLDGIREFLASHDADQHLNLVKTWEVLGEQATECRRQNTVNGAVVAVRQQATQYSLDILRGCTPGERTYTATGQTKAYSSNNGSGGTLGKA